MYNLAGKGGRLMDVVGTPSKHLALRYIQSYIPGWIDIDISSTGLKYNYIAKGIGEVYKTNEKGELALLFLIHPSRRSKCVGSGVARKQSCFGSKQAHIGNKCAGLIFRELLRLPRL